MVAITSLHQQTVSIVFHIEHQQFQYAIAIAFEKQSQRERMQKESTHKSRWSTRGYI